MIEITRGNASQYCEIIDFLDFVFSKNSVPHDFPLMYPNLYLPTDESMGNQLCLRENGVIKACLLSYPRIMSVNGEKLIINGIGNVACHPRERGRGFMSTLVKYNNEQMRLDGVTASDLGGRRLRYNHFGYDDGGTGYNASLPYNAVINTYPEAVGRYEFRLLESTQTELIGELKKLYESKSVHFDYDTDGFYYRLIIPFNGSVSYTVLSDGEVIGYIAVSGGEPYIREVILKDDKLISDVLLSFCALCKKDLRICFASWQLKYTQKLFSLAHDICLRRSHMWQIIDWKKMLSVLLNFKTSFTSLPEGEIVIDIEKYGRLKIENNGGVFTVEPTALTPDIVLSQLTAIGALTCAAPEMYTQCASLASDKALLFNLWFPIPLTMFDTERV